MKTHHSIFFAITFLSIIILHSCRYKEGPVISFRSAGNRFIGEWEVKKFLINDIDCTDVYNQKCNCKFGANYNGVSSNEGLCEFIDCKPDGRGIGGSYNFKPHSNNKIITIMMNTLFDFKDSTLNYNSQFIYWGPVGTPIISTDWEILKLKNKEMKLKCDYGGISYIIEFDKIKFY